MFTSCFFSMCCPHDVLKDGLRSYACLCVPGFNGSRCETNINECSPNLCQNGGSCIVSLISGCVVSVVVNSRFPCLLWAISSAKLLQCLHSQDQVNDFQCTCPSRYFGDWCQSERDECASHPCMNGATCHVSLQ